MTPLSRPDWPTPPVKPAGASPPGGPACYTHAECKHIINQKSLFLQRSSHPAVYCRSAATPTRSIPATSSRWMSPGLLLSSGIPTTKASSCAPTTTTTKSRSTITAGTALRSPNNSQVSDKRSTRGRSRGRYLTRSRSTSLEPGPSRSRSSRILVSETQAPLVVDEFVLFCHRGRHAT